MFSGLSKGKKIGRKWEWEEASLQSSQIDLLLATHSPSVMVSFKHEVLKDCTMHVYV